MKKLMIMLCALTLTACANDQTCLNPGELGRIVAIDRSQEMVGRVTHPVKMRLKNGATRVCLIDRFYTKVLQPGDVLQGPVTSTWDARQR